MTAAGQQYVFPQRRPRVYARPSGLSGLAMSRTGRASPPARSPRRRDALANEGERLQDLLLHTLWDGERFFALRLPVNEKVSADTLIEAIPLVLGDRLPKEVRDRVIPSFEAIPHPIRIGNRTPGKPALHGRRLLARTDLVAPPHPPSLSTDYKEAAKATSRMKSPFASSACAPDPDLRRISMPSPGHRFATKLTRGHRVSSLSSSRGISQDGHLREP